MGSLIICPFVYKPSYSSSNLSCSKVHFNINVRMYGSFGLPFLLMTSISSSQCLTSAYEAWSCFGARTISLPFDTQQITTVNIVFGNSARFHLAVLPGQSPKSVTSRLLPRPPSFLASPISLPHFIKHIWTHCRQICSALSKLPNGSQCSNVSKTSPTAVSLCRGPSRTCFKWFCPRIMDRCFIPRHPATHSFFHLLNAV